MKSVYFSVNNQKLKGTLIFPSNPKRKNPAVLLIHGWASSEESHIPRAQAISNLGSVCLTFNLRGHGKSEGKLEEFSRADHLQDCIAAYDFLSNLEEVNTSEISACGSSYGGYLAALVAAERNIKTLVLRAPALYRDDNFTTPTAEIIKNNPQVFQQNGLNKDNNNALRALSSFNGPILLIESEKDDIVPTETVRNYLYAANPKTLTHTIMKDADHRLLKEEWKKEYIEILTEWFRKFIAPQKKL